VFSPGQFASACPSRSFPASLSKGAKLFTEFTPQPMTSGIGIQEPAQCCAALTQAERDKINRAIELGGNLPPGESAEIIP